MQDTIEQFIQTLQHGNYFTLETTPAHSPTFQPIIDKIAELELDKKVDGFSTTDNPLAKLKYSAILGAIKLQQTFKKPVVATMSMRDRNKIGLQSDLLGANEFDIRTILALTGDSAKISDQPNTKGVFEGDSTLLLEMVRCFNSGIDHAGHPLKEKPQTIYPFTVMNAHAKNMKTLAKKMYKKTEAGSVGIITQPVYSLDQAKMLVEMMEETNKQLHTNTVLILGIFPITKLRTAQFLSSHVPGINVPNIWIDKLRSANAISAEEEKKVGFEMSLSLLDELQAYHSKIHMMTANNYTLADELLSTMKK